MSRLLEHLAKSGVQSSTRRGVSGKMTMTFRWELPTREFLDRLQRKEREVLFRTGRAMLRSYKKVLGKSYPKEKTPKGKRSARFTREIGKGNRHPYPYMRTGVLRNASEFYVDEGAGTVVAGPLMLSGHGWGTRVRSAKPVPQLLEEGGSAVVLTPVTTRRVRRDRKSVMRRAGNKRLAVRYRSFAYKHIPRATGIKVMGETLAKAQL